MQRLWAPWRETYISGLLSKPKGCIFCRILAGKKDKENLIFIRKERTFAVLNLYPYSNGHCLVLPIRHVSDISRLKPAEYIELMELLKETKELLQKALKPHGFNIGLNLGRVSGAGIPGHVHFHIVPRWKGDHNFMPVTADTRVISKSLSVIYKQLHDAYKTRH